MRQQAQEGGASLGKGGKLGHVADSFGKGDGGGPASEQGLKPPRRLAARVVVVKGEEDPGAAPEGRGDPLHALGAQGCDGRKAPSGKPQSTEGGRRVSVLKRQEGAPVNLG